MDILGGQRWILGGLRKRGGWTGDLITESSFIVAREQSITVNEKARIDLQMKISIDNRPAPMGVVIDLITDSTFYGISEPKKTCSFWTVWGDAGSTFKNSPQFGGLNDANKTYGWQTGHVYASAGSYTAVSFCRDWVSGKIGMAVHTFTVGADADTVYAGSNTIYLDTSGTFPDTQAGWQEVDNWADARAAIISAGHDTRLLLAAGTDIPIDTLGSVYNRCQWGVIGTGSRPRLVVANSGISSLLGSVIYNDDARGTGEGTVLWGFDIVGNYDPVNGVGETRQTTGIYLLGSQKVTVWDVNTEGLGISVRFRHGGVTRASELLIADCNITDWSDLPIFGVVDSTVIIGNSIRQNENAVSGPAAKDTYRNEIPGDGSTLTHTLNDVAIFGDVNANLKVFVRVDSSDTYTQLIKDTDFTFTEGVDPTSKDSNNGTHQITLSSAVAVGSTLIAHTRYYPSHGPVRIEEVGGVWMTNNWMRSENGWSTWNLEEGIYAVQSCIRWGSNGAEGDTGGIAYNLLEGGADIITTAPANGGIRQYPSGVLTIEQNYFKGYDATENTIRAGKTNTVIRNNHMLQQDMASIDSRHAYVAFVYAQKNGETLNDVDADSIDLYNNTVINLMSTANGARDTFALVENASSFPSINQGNNLVYHPDNVAPLPDYTPLNASDNYRPEEGSAAIDGGTPNALVWDDLAGNLVGETASIGAFYTVSPVVNQYFYDVADESAGSTLPSFMREALNTAAYTSTIASGTRPDGSTGNIWTLEHVNNATSLALIFDEMGRQSGDIDVLMLCQGVSFSTSLVMLRPATRVKEDTVGSTIPYWVQGGIRAETRELRIRSITSASPDSLASVSYSFPGGDRSLWESEWWYQRITETADGNISVKFWQYGTSEPATPQLTFDDTSTNRLAGEYVGIAGWNKSGLKVASVGIGLDGEEAPLS